MKFVDNDMYFRDYSFDDHDDLPLGINIMITV